VADFVQVGHKVNVQNDVILWDRVQRQCEQVKRALSATKEARYVIRDAFGHGDRVTHLDYLINRDDLAPLWSDLVARSIHTATDTIREAGMVFEELGAVLLIGGTTYVPQVRVAVAEAFGLPCAIEAEPQTAVARGAALLGAQQSLLTG
jgi:molecular chaperone DnaK (HSP70)